MESLLSALAFRNRIATISSSSKHSFLQILQKSMPISDALTRQFEELNSPPTVQEIIPHNFKSPRESKFSIHPFEFRSKSPPNIISNDSQPVDFHSTSQNSNHSQNPLRGFLIPFSSKDVIKSLTNGPRVGIFARPSAEFVTLVYATWLSGGVAVPLATSHPAAELLHVIRDSEVSIIADPDKFSLQQNNCVENNDDDDGVKSCNGYIHNNENNFENHSHDMHASFVKKINLSISNLQENQSAIIFYTSGTTGKPKGVVHTHQSIMYQIKLLCESWEYSKDEIFLNCLPLHHVHGFVNALFSPLYAGTTIEFLPKFSPLSVWQKWQKFYANDNKPVFSAVPTMYFRMIETFENFSANQKKEFSEAANFHRLMMSGSSACPFSTFQKWKKISGHCLMERYGMTEFGMAISNPLHGDRRVGFVGFPLKGVQTKIKANLNSDLSLNSNSNSNLKNENMEEGDLWVKSPSLFREYWKNDEETRSCFDDDGFFNTGDVVRVENNYFKILGRSSVDILKVGGYKISALEIESVISQHPMVNECAVLGMDDEDLGQRIVAMVALKETKMEENGLEEKRKDNKNSDKNFQSPSLTLLDLNEWARNRLAPYKLLKVMHIVPSIPRNAMGKVNKKSLKELFLSNQI